MKKAAEAEMDLVAIAPGANPPVARVIDLGKYMYEQEKKDKEAKKKQKDSNTVKGTRISIRMSERDLQIQARKLEEFLRKGYKVRVELIMRGREKGLRDIANERIKSFLNMIEEPYKIETPTQKQPRGLFFTLGKE